MAGTTGLEPATSAVTGQRSNQLSYVPESGQLGRMPPEPMISSVPGNRFAAYSISAPQGAELETCNGGNILSLSEDRRTLQGGRLIFVFSWAGVGPVQRC